MQSVWKDSETEAEAWLVDAPADGSARAVRLQQVVGDVWRQVSFRPLDVVNALAAKVEALSREVNELRASIKAQHPLSPLERWRRENIEVLREHAGQVVAIHPERGIVASGVSLREVGEQVRERGLSGIVFEKVRAVVSRQ